MLYQLLLFVVHSVLASALFSVKAAAFHANNRPNAWKVRGRDHPTTPKSRRFESSSPSDRSLRDGPPNLSPPNTMEAILSRLAEINLELPPPGGPKANYQLVHRDGDLLYLSGHLPTKADGSLIVGACAPSHVIEGDKSQNRKWLSTEQGYEAAQRCALNLLSTLQFHLSIGQAADLSCIKIVKLFGIVRSHDEFAEQHLVMNGASDVLKQALGEDKGGCHARSAIGTNTLPLGICVEVEMIAKITGTD